MEPTSPTGTPRQTLPARLRVKRARAFQEAYAQGQKEVGRFFILWSRTGEGACARLGVVASRKVGNSVARSRAKRRLRELYRLNRQRITGGDDVILVARHSLPKAPWDLVLKDFERVFSRAGRLQCPEECRKPPPPASGPDATDLSEPSPL